MKGLIRKDLYMLWRYGRTLLLISVAFLVFSTLSDGDNFFFVVYPVLFGGILPVTLISYEERDGWNRNCDTMPVSRRTVVSERYLMTLGCFLLLYLLTLTVHGAVLIPGGKGALVLQMAALLPCFGLAAPAVMLPVTLRWGVEKGRLAYYVILGVTLAAGIFLFDSISDMSTAVQAPGLEAAPGLTLLLFGGSWLLSMRIYEKREL